MIFREMIFKKLPWRSTKTYTVVWYRILELRRRLVFSFGYGGLMGTNIMGFKYFLEIPIFRGEPVPSRKNDKPPRLMI